MKKYIKPASEATHLTSEYPLLTTSPFDPEGDVTGAVGTKKKFFEDEEEEW